MNGEGTMSISIRGARHCAGTLAAGLALAVLAAACHREAPSPPEPRLVRTIVVSGAQSGAFANYTGEIKARYETDLSFQVGGKIVSRSVDAGAFVKQGAVLAQLDQTDQRVSVEGARSAVAAARAELERAKTEEARYRDLLERGLTTRASYLQQQTAVKTGQSKLEQATSELQLNEQRLAYTTLRADHDGVVTRLYAEVGGVVASGQRVLSVARPEQLEAVFDVPDGRVDEIRGVKAVRVALLSDPSAQYDSTIREIAPMADAATRTYQIKAAIASESAHLRLGTSVTVAVPESGSATAVALPATALFQQDHGPAVWIVRDDLTLELRPVNVARYESDSVLLSSGVSTGERVVTAGVHRLGAGEHVRLMEDNHE
jgi:RND family efflux transporter MFP subunit